MNAPRRPGGAGLAGRIAALALLGGIAAFALSPSPFTQTVGNGAALVAKAAAHATRVTVLGAHALAGVVAAPARAQSGGTMEFKPVPEESARAFDRRQGSRVTRTSTTAPATAAAPVPPAPKTSAVPEPPAAPEAPSTSGDVVRMGSDITIERNEVVDGDVLTFGGNIRVEGTVRGNVSATGGDVTLASTARVEGDVLCIGGELHEEDGAYVGGQRVTGLQGRDRRVRVDGERIRDRVSDRIDDRIRDELDGHDSRAGKILRRLTYLLFWLAVAWAVTKFAPRRTAGAMQVLRREPGLSFGVGFGMMLLIVPSVVAMALVVAILCITIIGIPVAIGAMLAYVALIILVSGWGYVVGAAALGERLGGSGRGGFLGSGSLRDAALRGVLLIQGAMFAATILAGMPVLGWIGGLVWVLALVAFSVVGLLGIGAVVRAKFGQGSGGQWWPPSRLFGSLDAVPPAAPAGYAAPPPPASAPASWVPDVPAAPGAPVAPAPPPPPPASPPASFMPPGNEPPPPPATPGT